MLYVIRYMLPKPWTQPCADTQHSRLALLFASCNPKLQSLFAVLTKQRYSGNIIWPVLWSEDGSHTPPDIGSHKTNPDITITVAPWKKVTNENH